jgi:hypothetical protein
MVLLAAGFLLSLLFNHENGSKMSLQKFGLLSLDYAALYARRWSPKFYGSLFSKQKKLL